MSNVINPGRHIRDRAMTEDILAVLPARRGHFLLESGYHADTWFSLDELFANPAAVAPLVATLAERLRPHGARAVCGPLLGGAFLAQALATRLGVRFFYTEPLIVPQQTTLFTAQYRLSLASRRAVRGEPIAVVDDAISAGSSVRATIDSLATAGASTVVVGAFLTLGDAALTHFAEQGVPVETLQRRRFELWEPNECPLCREGIILEDPHELPPGMRHNDVQS